MTISVYRSRGKWIGQVRPHRGAKAISKSFEQKWRAQRWAEETEADLLGVPLPADDASAGGEPDRGPRAEAPPPAPARATGGRARMTWHEACADWITRRDVHPSTRKNYERFLRIGLTDTRLAKVRLGELTTADVQRWVVELRDSGASDHKIGGCQVVLFGAAREAWMAGDIVGNPCAPVRKVVPPPAARRPPTPARSTTTRCGACSTRARPSRSGRSSCSASTRGCAPRRSSTSRELGRCHLGSSRRERVAPRRHAFEPTGRRLAAHPAPTWRDGTSGAGRDRSTRRRRRAGQGLGPRTLSALQRAARA